MKATKAPISARPTTPPTTPPAIAPVWLLEVDCWTGAAVLEVEDDAEAPAAVAGVLVGATTIVEGAADEEVDVRVDLLVIV